jgi:hypothetical protein
MTPDNFHDVEKVQKNLEIDYLNSGVKVILKPSCILIPDSSSAIIDMLRKF